MFYILVSQMQRNEILGCCPHGPLTFQFALVQSRRLCNHLQVVMMACSNDFEAKLLWVLLASPPGTVYFINDHSIFSFRVSNPSTINGNFCNVVMIIVWFHNPKQKPIENCLCLFLNYACFMLKLDGEMGFAIVGSALFYRLLQTMTESKSARLLRCANSISDMLTRQ